MIVQIFKDKVVFYSSVVISDGDGGSSGGVGGSSGGVGGSSWVLVAVTHE